MHRSGRRYVMLMVVRLWLLISIMFFAVNDLYANDVTVWDSLKSGNHFALLRHAIAPGTGDPSNFVVDECSTQRNLSSEGRNQARAIGDLFRINGINKAKVFSSQWCRCLETATLLSVGSVQELPALNSFFRKYDRQQLQTQMLKKWLAQQDLTVPTLLVTHQVNITALTNVYPSSGEMVVVKRSESGELIVAGRHQIQPQ